MIETLKTLAYVVPAFVILLTIVVFVHEFGHFIVGRWCGVKVDAFSIGFGKELWLWVDRHGTRWRLAAIPLGGFVKFHGDANAASVTEFDALDSMPPEERAVTFAAQSLPERAAIVFAGPFANFLLAIAIFASLLYFNGRTVIAPRIGTVIAGGAGAAAGFQPGDFVVSIDGAALGSFGQLQEIVSMSAEKPLEIVVLRNGAEIKLHAVPAWREVENAVGKIRIGMLGLHASTAPGDSRRETYGPAQCLALAVDETWQIASRTLGYLGGLLTGRERADQLSGPIGIAQMSGQVAKATIHSGVTPFLNWIALLSVSIGLLNLMPIPLLDGGHLLFFGIEAIRGRALNERAQEVAFRVGLAVVGGMMIFSTYNDVARLLQRLTGGAS
jgi:regulator of sigma E protease